MALAGGSLGTFAVANNTTATPTLPTNNAGDLIVLYCTYSSAAGTMGTPTGYTSYLQETNTNGTHGPAQAVFWKISGGSDSNPSVTVSGGSLNDMLIVDVFTFTGTHQTTPFLNTGTFLDDTIQHQNIQSITGITIANNDAVLVLGCKSINATSTATLSGDTLTWAEIDDLATTSTGNKGYLVWDYAINSSGSSKTIATKTFTVTGGGANFATGVMIELQPPASSTVVPTLALMGVGT